MADLSTTASSNNPPGTETVGTNADDYHRGIQAIVRRESNKGADIASASTLTPGSDGNYFTVTGTTTINAIAGSWVGREVTLAFAGALTITHGSNLILPGGGNITTSAGQVYTFVQETATPTWRSVSVSTPPIRHIARTIFTASGTWNRAATTQYEFVTLRGGGGGGGGALAVASTQGDCGSGGGEGAEVNIRVTGGATEVVTIGAGGAGGVGDNNGSTGGTTSFGSLATATGGLGGTHTVGTLDDALDTVLRGGDGGGGSGTNAFIKGGTRGGDAIHFPNFTNFPVLAAGNGAGPGAGVGGVANKDVAVQNGTAGVANSGGGGGGGAVKGNNTANGGAGGSGIVVVDEFGF
jgi:hypothetical protein